MFADIFYAMLRLHLGTGQVRVDQARAAAWWYTYNVCHHLRAGHTSLKPRSPARVRQGCVGGVSGCTRGDPAGAMFIVPYLSDKNIHLPTSPTDPVLQTVEGLLYFKRKLVLRPLRCRASACVADGQGSVV